MTHKDEGKSFDRSSLYIRNRKNEPFDDRALPELADFVHIFSRYVVILLDGVGGKAIGFTNFSMDMRLRATGRSGSAVELDVEPNRVWVAKAHRGKGWSKCLGLGVASTVEAYVNMIDRETSWPEGFEAKLEVTAKAELYSRGGEAFLIRTRAQIRSALDTLRHERRFVTTKVKIVKEW